MLKSKSLPSKKSSNPRAKKSPKLTAVETSPTSVELTHRLANISVVGTTDGIEVLVRSARSINVAVEKSRDGAEIKIVYNA